MQVRIEFWLHVLSAPFTVYNLTKEHRKKAAREIFLGVKSRKF